EADAHDVRIVRAPAPERRAADGAEVLREAAVAGVVAADELLAGQHAKRSGRDPRLRRGGRARAPLAARAVAVAGRDERLGHLEADASAQAATGQRQLGHGA